jgi:hypothetical protein
VGKGHAIDAGNVPARIGSETRIHPSGINALLERPDFEHPQAKAAELAASFAFETFNDVIREAVERTVPANNGTGGHIAHRPVKSPLASFDMSANAMADFAITAANVRSTATPRRANAAAAITAGQALAKDGNGDLVLYDANSGTALTRTFVGFAVNGGAIGQPILSTAELDPAYTPGCALAVGDIIIGSATPGAIAPSTDAAAGMYVTALGIAISTTQMTLQPMAAGAVKV